MTRGEGACLVCGKPIIYFDKAKKMKCVIRNFKVTQAVKTGILSVMSVMRKRELIW